MSSVPQTILQKEITARVGSALPGSTGLQSRIDGFCEEFYMRHLPPESQIG